MKPTTKLFKPTYKEYSIFICRGERKGRVESGSYTHLAGSYIEAATTFGNHWNKCTALKTYGNEWKISHRAKSGYPKSHCYLKDNLGNKILIIKK